ncbi:MAG: hypothetical protein M1834_007305 [Cirrosporium novae-zelandiae]|nr:MAG: hypothetical protein M1834_007305 [Cirrosporium novae-zelandiae]
MAAASLVASKYYAIAEASEYLVVTGAGIQDLEICKTKWVYPWQKCQKVSLKPFDIKLTLQAMTKEKLQFSLPAVFTIGPNVGPGDYDGKRQKGPSIESMRSFKKYAMLLTSNEGKTKNRTAPPSGEGHVQDIVRGIVEGETRVIVADMTMEEIFKERQIFKTKIIERVQVELDQFGLRIYNANVKELQDTPGSEYFAFLSRKAHEGALNQARVDVAEARMRGEIGEAEKQGRTKQEISRINAETAVKETQRKAEKAEADATLKIQTTNFDRDTRIAGINADRTAETKDAELMKHLNKKRAENELERLRATDVVKSQIAKESARERSDAEYYSKQKYADAERYKKIQEAEAFVASQEKNADADLYSKQKSADAYRYKTTQEAEAFQASKAKETDAEFYTRQKSADGQRYKTIQEAEASFVSHQKEADADFYRRKQQADAAFYSITKEAEAGLVARKKEAEGLIEMAKAYGQLANVMGGPQGLLQYMMLQDNTYEKLAKANAEAIRGLEPKITVWNTGENASAEAGAPIRNIMQSLPPLLSTINEQTGISPPSWLAQMDGNQNGPQEDGQLTKKQQILNGSH